MYNWVTTCIYTNKGFEFPENLKECLKRSMKKCLKHLSK